MKSQKISTSLFFLILTMLPNFFTFKLNENGGFKLFIAIATVYVGIDLIVTKFIYSLASNHECVFSLRLKIYDLFKTNDKESNNIQMKIEEMWKEEILNKLYVNIFIYGICDYIDESVKYERTKVEELIKTGKIKDIVKNSKVKKNYKKMYLRCLKQYNGPFNIRDTRVEYETGELLKHSYKGEIESGMTILGLILSIVGLIGLVTYEAIPTGNYILMGIMTIIFLIGDIERYFECRKFLKEYYSVQLKYIEKALMQLGDNYKVE